ncbi:MAG: hypothetical protein K6G18_13830 [Treponema sp.]|nr:hypothetical protein [Treponema sp.]
MVFLIPVLAGVAASAISAGEVVAGIAGIVGIGAAVKGALDCSQANDIRREAEEKYDDGCERLRAEVLRTQRKAEEFGNMKKKTYSGILKESVAAVAGSKLKGSGINLNACAAEDLSKDISRFENRFAGEPVPFASLVRTSGVQPIMAGMMANIGVFGSGVAALSFVPYLLPSMLGIAVKGSRMLVESERFAGTVDVECERIEDKITLCKALRKRIMEGMKVTQFLSEKLSSCMSRFDAGKTADDVLLDRTLSIAVALKKVMEAEICRTDGTFIAETERYFKKIMQEEW